MKYLQSNSIEEKALLDRFIRYVKTYSTSSQENADKGITPSTPQQAEFAKQLAAEMEQLPLADVQISEHSYVYGYLPATKGKESLPSFCVMAHMDTVEEVSGKDVKPNIIKNYDGSAITLANGLVLDPAANPALVQAGAERDTIITTDGTTLLGADDKAGIAAIMTAMAYLVAHPEVSHGKIEVMFSPDEETGHGMDRVPLKTITSKRAYTVDGGHIGELETECFTAFRSDVTFTGKSTHTGTARAEKMVNAVSMAAAFVASLPRHEAPETTDGHEGFYAPMDISGSIETAHVMLLLRDFSATGMEQRKTLVQTIAQSVATSYGGSVTVQHTQQYLNMKEKLDTEPEVVQNLYKAYNNAGITPVNVPIRGGTDGSRLTEMGIPTPNIFTGGHNYHSRYEWASLSQMLSAAEVILQLAVITAQNS
ncbi:MAG: peptidase T [Treponema sp.]|nr:peptidase T [Treponema sp.]